MSTSQLGLILIVVGLVVGALGPLVAPYDVVVLNVFRQLVGRRPARDRATRGFMWVRLVVAGIVVVVGIALVLIG